MEARSQSRVASWINVIAGAWLIIAPFVLNYTNGTPMTNDIWLGIIVGVLALIRAFSAIRSTYWLSWVSVVAGIWLIIAPFTLGYTNGTAITNDIILGIVVSLVALWNLGAGNLALHGGRGTRPAL
jgi:hypothetical protein